MPHATVLSPWTGTGASPADAFRPLLADAHSLLGWRDVSGQPAAHLPPSPNLLLVEAEMSDAVLADVLADPVWTHSTLWAEGERPPDEVPGDAEYESGCETFALALGVPLEAVLAVIGPAAGGRTRRTIADGLIPWLQSLQKGV